MVTVVELLARARTLHLAIGVSLLGISCPPCPLWSPWSIVFKCIACVVRGLRGTNRALLNVGKVRQRSLVLFSK